jgi:hypothetical protein
MLFPLLSALIEETVSGKRLKMEKMSVNIRSGVGGTVMKKLIVLVVVVLGLLAIMPAMEIDSATQVFSRVGMAESGGGD